MDAPMEFLNFRRPGRRNRRWPDAKKAAIVAETLEPGASVASVAAQHGLKPNHVSAWRTLARQGRLLLPAPETPMEFASLVVSPDRGEAGSVQADAWRPDACAGPGSAASIVLGPVTIRLEPGASAERIALVARLLADRT